MPESFNIRDPRVRHIRFPGLGQSPPHRRYDVVLVGEDGAVQPPGMGHGDTGVGDALYWGLQVRDGVAAGYHRRYLAAEAASPDGLMDYDQPSRLAYGPQHAFQVERH